MQALREEKGTVLHTCTCDLYICFRWKRFGKMNPPPKKRVKRCGAVAMLYSLRLGRPDLIPVLVSDPEEGDGLEAQADDDLGQNREEQRAGNQPRGRALGHQLRPRWVQTHWVEKRRGVRRR